jgi:hypothetical protein
MDSCLEKIFIFKLTGRFFILDEKGMINFCHYPEYIPNQNEIRWSPLFKHGAENPWGVSINNIRVEH